MIVPKQEKRVCRNKAVLKVPLTGSVGAVFDFLARIAPVFLAGYVNRGLNIPIIWSKIPGTLGSPFSFPCPNSLFM
jgi:hypothetical protein